jgi:uncharacterized protein
MTCVGVTPTVSGRRMVGNSPTVATRHVPSSLDAVMASVVRPSPGPEFRPTVALVAWLGAFAVGQLGASAIAAAAGYGDVDTGKWPLWVVAVTFGPLWLAILGALALVSRAHGTGRFRRDFGLDVRPMDVPVGLAVGAVSQMVFVPVLYLVLDVFIDTSDKDNLAKELTDKASGWSIVVLIAVVAIGAPIVEELLYRGLLLRAFGSRVNDVLALVLSSALFAVAHFQALQFAGLMLFGLIAGYLAQRSGRLGLSIFSHIGFNSAALIALLIKRH